MKKINKKLISSIILGLVLYTPVTNVYAAQLNDGPIFYNDSESTVINEQYKQHMEDNNGVYTYDFGEDSILNFTTKYQKEHSGAIYIHSENNSNNFNTLKINDRLDIEFNLNNNSGALSGIAITRGDGKTIDRRNGGDIKISSYDDVGYNHTKITGVTIYENHNTVWIGDGDITIEARNVLNDMAIDGLLIGGGQNDTINMGNGKIKITGNIKSNNDTYRNQVLGFNVSGINNIINTEDVSIDIDVTGDIDNNTTNKVYGIYAVDGGEVNTGSGDVEVTAINPAGGEVNSVGIFVYYGGTVTKEGGNITVIAAGEDTVKARGVVVNDNSTVDLGLANIRVKTIGSGNNVVSKGLYTFGNGEIRYAGGQIDVVAYNDDATTYNDNADIAAIHAEDSATVKVNENRQNKVVINGDVNNTGNGAIFLNLNTTDSVLNGGVDDANGTFNLANNAQWNVLDESTVNNFNIDNGIVNMRTAGDVSIANYSGNGTVYFQAEDVASNGVMVLNTGDIEIENAVQGSNITLGVANNTINTLDIAKTEENLNALAEKISYDAKDGNLNGKVVIKEGLITPEASGDLMFGTNDRGYVTNITGGNRTTDTMYAMKNMAATAIVAWRQEDSTLSQRLGELRDSEDGQGIWVRMSRGEFEYDGEYKNQYNFFQMGYDWAADDWHYGAAISHNDGQTTYTYGDGENRSTSLSLYGTWLGDKGHYADIVLKQGRLSNDFDIYTSAGHTSGDYDAWGTSLSGEYGKKIALEDDWYVTPQAQLTLMRIGGEDYTTNNGINVHQDTLHSVVGRLGFELGKKIDDKGSVYAKASLLHDFAGNAETYLSYNGFANSYMQDISDTWCEAGIGFNYKTSDNSYVYADVVKTFGGDVETPWQWNAGMRWSF